MGGRDRRKDELRVRGEAMGGFVRGLSELVVKCRGYRVGREKDNEEGKKPPDLGHVAASRHFKWLSKIEIFAPQF